MEFDELEDWEEGAGTDLRSSSSHDLHLDVWATLRAGTLQAIREEMLAGVLRRVAKPGREPRADIKRNAEVMVSTIIANLIMLHQLRPAGAALVVALANTKQTRYDRSGFQKLSKALEGLQDLGLIDKVTGEYKRSRTTLQARGRLLHSVTSSPSLLADVIRAEGQELIVLNARPEVKRLRQEEAQDTDQLRRRCGDTPTEGRDGGRQPLPFRQRHHAERLRYAGD